MRLGRKDVGERGGRATVPAMKTEKKSIWCNTYIITVLKRWASICGEPGLVDKVLALHAGSRGFDSHRGHMSERFFRSNRPGYPHSVSSELEIVVSEWRSVIAVSLNVGGGVRLIKPAKLCMCTQNTTNTTRTDARRRVCAAMVPYR